MPTINAGDKNPQRINWHRLWEPVQLAGASRELSIISPVSPVIRSEHSVRYEDLDVLGCLVLLGPPGSGKSTELEAACRAAEKDGRITSIVRLRSVPTIEDLKSTLQKAKTAWEDGTTNWYIFIDGLDEAPVYNREMQSWILSIFRDIVRLAGDRLELPKLRLTCRSADWPDRFEEDLSTIWGQERTGVFQLTELAIEDVKLSVESWTSDQRESFIECLNTQGLWSLARSPVTLGMLERIFATFGGKLPSSLVATYRAALLALVEDPRRLSDVPAAAGNFAPIELLRLLGRIATVSILSGKPIIWSGLYADPVPLDAVSVTELSGGVETNLPHPVIADERAFRQALRTAVFRSDGRNRSAWVHQSFAEFLSADYLAQGVSSPERMLELLSVDEGGSRRVPAQAREVAAWLAGIHKEFRRLLIKSEPDLLLRSDVASADTEFKSDLTKELLARISSDEALDVWRDPRIKFERLNYPRISDGLRPYILDQKYNHAVRRAAIGIARDCRASDSRGDLLQVAHDATENSHMRAAAVIALGALNDEESLSQIKPLLNTSHDSDPQDEIRGAVLRTLWPRQLSEKELFEALSAPRDNHLLGWYKAFIYQLKIESLSRDGALAAIRWIRNFPLSSEVQITFRTLVANVLTAVWHCASDDDVMREIVNMFTASPHNYGGVLSVVDLSDFRSEFYNSPQNLRRRLVIETAVSASDTQSAISAIMYGPWRFVVAADLPWILEDLVDEQSSIPKNTLLEIVILLIHGREVEDVSCVWDYAAKYPPLAEALTSLFTTHLDSPTAMWAKQDHERRVKTARQESQTPARSEQLARLLDLCDSDPSQWWRVNFALLDSDKPTGTN